MTQPGDVPLEEWARRQQAQLGAVHEAANALWEAKYPDPIERASATEAAERKRLQPVVTYEQWLQGDPWRWRGQPGNPWTGTPTP